MLLYYLQSIESIEIKSVGIISEGQLDDRRTLFEQIQIFIVIYYLIAMFFLYRIEAKEDCNEMLERLIYICCKHIEKICSSKNKMNLNRYILNLSYKY